MRTFCATSIHHVRSSSQIVTWFDELAFDRKEKYPIVLIKNSEVSTESFVIFDKRYPFIKREQRIRHLATCQIYT